MKEDGGVCLTLNLASAAKETNGHSSYKCFTYNNNLTSVENQQFQGTTPRKKLFDDRFEVPLPFGYHLDLDFLRCCAEDLVSDDTLRRLKELRRTRKIQRKTFETLIRLKEKAYLEKMRQRVPNVYNDRKKSYPDTGHALKEVIHDFETCLNTSPVQSLLGFQTLNSKEGNDVDSSYYDDKRSFTFPRSTSTSSGTEEHIKLNGQSSSSSLSSGSSVPHSPEAVLACLPSSVPNRLIADAIETDSIASISSEMSSTTLRNIREQMVKSLFKIRDYEKQVEAIPVMQVKLSVLKEEKRLLMLKLKQREFQLNHQQEIKRFDEDDTVDDKSTEFLRRARSESPYGRTNKTSVTVDPENFISFMRKRSISEHSMDALPPPFHYPQTERWISRQNVSLSNCTERSEISFLTRSTSLERNAKTNQLSGCGASPVLKCDKSCNTADDDVPVCVVRKVSHSTNTLRIRTVNRATSSIMLMKDVYTRSQIEDLIQAAIIKKQAENEEEKTRQICSNIDKETSLVDAVTQVGSENLIPFVIDVGLQCKIQDIKPICYDCGSQTSDTPILKSHSIDSQDESSYDYELLQPAGESVYNRPLMRSIGMCTEKWVETITACKQTDTEDFAYKDTDSPRVADMILDSPVATPTSHYQSKSYRKSVSVSPCLSRRSSSVLGSLSRKSSVFQSTMSLQNVNAVKVSTRDAKSGLDNPVLQTRSIGTSTLILPLSSLNSPFVAEGTVSSQNQSREKLNLCDKCCQDINEVARELISMPRTISLPSPDHPWISKIPRPILPLDVSNLKSAVSIGNLASDRPKSPLLLTRSKSNLTPTFGRKFVTSSKSSPLSPSQSHRPLGTPPPYPLTPGSKRSSPLPLAQQIIKSNKQGNKTSPVSSNSSSSSSTTADSSKSLIPRIETPPALRKMYPSASDGGDKLASLNRNVIRKRTHTKASTGVCNPALDSTNISMDSKSNLMDIPERLSEEESGIEDELELRRSIDFVGPRAETLSDDTKNALNLLCNSQANHGSPEISKAINVLQKEWFKTSSTKQSSSNTVQSFLRGVQEEFSDLLDRVVNLTDVNGNTALHYSVSHGNFEVVSVLLDSKVANPNILNKAGYTCIMLISLAILHNSAHRDCVLRLFALSDVNIRARQHGQTALMLAVSHGRIDMVQLLVEAGADINVRDEDGSTALMCSAEHGYMDIVKYLLSHSETNVYAKDNDGLTALGVAMEAGHRDIGVVLYASMSFSRGVSPYSSSMRTRGSSPSNSSRTSTPSSPHISRQSTSLLPVPFSVRSRRNSSNQ